MLTGLIIFLIILAVFIYFFVLGNISPIPYFPTQWKDLDFVSNELLNYRKQNNLKFKIQNSKLAEHVIIDLGAGTGTVIFEAAKIAYIQQNLKEDSVHASPQRSKQVRMTNAKFIAIEINPFLVWIMQIRRLFHPNRQNIIILKQNIFDINFKKLLPFDFCLLTLYLYVGPYVWNQLIPVLNAAPKNTRIISYMYKIPGWEKRLKQTKQAVKKMYIY